ncbi:hypothetical protein ACMU_11185 [Actibacterium mucosum KCTC 23349]|uniref:Uncharacterized protein n=1 Tax=Actibacterium mucosum KCTC 23349 TaxID=1454373 RepID=A0A037ZK97_9RHOB|nr:hypothetical protein [Actibacterium mucosum]KAJ55256.1 hypothetical protein ACMU_11185 [Actibacterium mucosum KCTC 23349]
MKISVALPLITAALFSGSPVAAFTTAEEVRPILEVTQANWIAVREYEGQDLLYFTHLASFRCGLFAIAYGVNTDVADQLFEAEPCYREEPAPNALKMENGALPFVGLPLGSVEYVTITITYLDGVQSTVRFDRADIQIP